MQKTNLSSRWVGFFLLFYGRKTFTFLTKWRIVYNMEEIKQENSMETVGGTPPTLQEKEKSTVWKGVFFLILSAFFFSLMSLFVRLSGNLPTFQKAFFRNIIATIAAAVVLARSKSFKMNYIGSLIKGSRCLFFTIFHRLHQLQNRNVCI